MEMGRIRWQLLVLPLSEQSLRQASISRSSWAGSSTVPVLTISSALPGEINLYFKYGLDSRYLKTSNCSAASSGTLGKERGETERAPARSSEFRRTRKTNRADQGCGSLAAGSVRTDWDPRFLFSFQFFFCNILIYFVGLEI